MVGTAEGERQDGQARLNAIASALRADEQAPVITVRAFLEWFSAQRRGWFIVKEIRSALKRAGLTTQPDFESTYLDGEISFGLASKATSGADDSLAVEVAETVRVSDHTEVRVTPASFGDPTYRMSKLAASNRQPTSVKPDALVREAVTLMMINDFSQMPVMSSDREVKGIVSWRSIGSRLAMGQTPPFVRDAMDPHAEISADASLSTAIPLIVEHQYVLVRGSDKRVVGIVTTTDLSLQFQQLAEPFLLLGEIENHIRRIIGSHLDLTELAAAKGPDNRQSIESVADLDFGGYRRLLEQPTCWERLKLPVDRQVFIEKLDRVRQIRNDVVHFDPDGVTPDEVETLRDFARFLRTLQTIGVT